MSWHVSKNNEILTNSSYSRSIEILTKICYDLTYFQLTEIGVLGKAGIRVMYRAEEDTNSEIGFVIVRPHRIMAKNVNRDYSIALK